MAAGGISMDGGQARYKIDSWELIVWCILLADSTDVYMQFQHPHKWEEVRRREGGRARST